MQIALAPSGDFRLTTPAGNTVTVPATPIGLVIIRRMLEAQAVERRPTLGTDASPIQHMVDEWLKEDAARKRAELRTRLAKHGLTSITLTI